MTMPPALRKFALTAHVACSAGLLGAVASFLVLAVAGLTGGDDGIVRAAYGAMKLIAWLVIMPLALAALLTGLVQSLGSKWGLLRHYWILVKLAITMAVAIILLIQLEPISNMADAASAAALSPADFRAARISLVIHAAGGLVVLLLPVALSLYKPQGLTRYGWRKLHGP